MHWVDRSNELINAECDLFQQPPTQLQMVPPNVVATTQVQGAPVAYPSYPPQPAPAPAPAPAPVFASASVPVPSAPYDSSRSQPVESKATYHEVQIEPTK